MKVLFGPLAGLLHRCCGKHCCVNVWLLVYKIMGQETCSQKNLEMCKHVTSLCLIRPSYTSTASRSPLKPSYIKYGCIGATFRMVSCVRTWFRWRREYAYWDHFEVSAVVICSSVTTCTSEEVAMFLGRQSRGGGPISSDPSPCKKRLLSTSKAAAPMVFDPIHGQKSPSPASTGKH